MTAPALARKARPGEPGFSEGARVYEHPRTKMVVPSITAIKEVLDKPALKYWAAGRCADYAANSLDELAKIEDVNARKAVIREAPWRDSDAAADIGDIVHNAIDGYIKTGQSPMSWQDWPVTARHMWQSFCSFLNEYKPTFIDAEFTVWSNTWQYAGTMDWSAHIRGWTVLGDTKTGKGVYPDFGLQLSAGAFADFILRNDGTEVELPKYNRCAVLHVRPRSTTLIPLDKMPECFEAFKAARMIKQWRDYHAANVLIEAPKVQTGKDG